MNVPEVLNSAHKVDYVGQLPTLNFFEHSDEALARATKQTQTVGIQKGVENN
jgi:hypothetical protein